MVIIGVLLLTPALSYPQNTRTPAPKTSAALGGEQMVSIDFNNVDIGVFIKFISDLTKKNFVIDERVRGKVTIISPGKISVAEAFRVFESVLEVHGYATVQSGEITKIVPAPEARSKNIKTRLQEESSFPGDTVITQIMPLRYADPNQIKQLFTPLVSKSSVILAYQPTNTLIVTDVASNINRLMKILNNIDVTGVGQQISLIPVEYADASKLVNVLNSIFKSAQKAKAPQDRDITFVADERTNTIVLLASEADTENIRRLVKNLDKETPRGQAKIHVYYLEHAKAEDLAQVLQDIPKKDAAGKAEAGKPTAPVVSGNVRITADKATNSLIIMADMEDYVVLQEIIRKIDIPRSMVYIEALIMEVNVNKDFRLGTQFQAGEDTTFNDKDVVYGGGFAAGTLGGEAGSHVGAITSAGRVNLLPPGFSMGVFGEALEIAGITFPSLSAVVQAYKKDSDVSILSTPQILTTDNQEAKIYVGANVPFQTTATATATGSEVYNSFEYRDVGKTLKITPQISKGRNVVLEISLEVSSVSGGSTEFRPTTLKRTIETTAVVQDGNTVVLGGLIDSTNEITDFKVPCLGDIPGLGLLFRNTAKANEKTNLYVFLTPRVIQNAEEAIDLSSQKRDEIDSVREEDIKLYKNKAKPENSSSVTPDDSSKLNHPAASDSGSTALPDPQPRSLEKNSAPDRQSVSQAPLDTADTATPVSTPKARPSEPETDSAPDSAGQAAPAKATRPHDKVFEGYTIQVASVQTTEQAGRLLEKLTGSGYAAYTVRSDVKGEVWYRLRIGFFSMRKAAQETMDRLRRDHYNPILIKL